MFNFPKADRENNLQYKRNFLKSVIFQVKFAKNKKIQDNKQQIKELFIDELPRYSDSINQGFKITATVKGDSTPILEPLQDTMGLEMKSMDGNKVLSINVDSFTFTVSGEVYENFQSLQNDLNELSNFLRLCEIETVERIAIRKINMIDFLIGDSNEMEIASQILNKQLCSNFGYFPDKDKIVQNIHSINYHSEESRLLLKYGLFTVDSSDKRDSSSILIDIDMISNTSVKSEDVLHESDRINNEVFNVFHWTLSSESIKALNYIDEY